MNNVYFAIALHFHQPVGNFENVIERAYQFCYKPFLELLSNYPDIKMTFHISGCLLDYLEGKHPEILNLIRDMVSRGQIEIMSGGYYEPILTGLPERDIKGQIQMMSDYIEKRFFFSPKGMWIPERVWEPWLVKPIRKAGIKYSILDDTHLLRSGVKKGDMYGYFMASHAGSEIAIFPSDKTLRYAIPFQLPEKTLEYFGSLAEKKENLLFVYGDDGEKFGEWPGTHKWVFGEGWLKKFFDTLLKNRDWMSLVKFSDYLSANEPLGSIEIKPGSYEEMMEWSDGSWMNFMKKYPEADQMHKKMIYVSEKLETIDIPRLRSGQERQETSDKEAVEIARRELYRGQCNCGYWHGVFGGLYLYHLRRAIYNHLIAADKILDAVIHGTKKDWVELKEIDIDLDGKKENLIESEAFSLNIDPSEGGVMKELDYRPLSVNLINTLSRKREAYHEKILENAAKDSGKVKTIHDDSKPVQPGTARKLIYDRYPRYCLRDYLIDETVGLNDFINSNFKDAGNFTNGPYIAKKIEKGFILERKDKTGLAISKSISIKSNNELEILYSVRKKGKSDIDRIFGIEFNITMPDLNSDKYNYFCNDRKMADLAGKGSVLCNSVDSFAIEDYNKKCSMRLSFSQPAEVWYFPVETVSQSERSYELHYQCSCIFPRWRINFNKKGFWDLKIIWTIV